MQETSFKMDRIKETLERNGFQTSWIDPFKKWQRPDLYDGKEEAKTGETLYVLNPPAARIVPFDLAVVSIKIDDQGIYFELSFYYADIMEDQTEAHAFNAIYEIHESWHSCLVSFYRDLAEKYSLRWNIEHEDYIEDTLFGSLESEESVLNILMMMKHTNTLSSLRSHCTTDSASDIPEIDCKLKEYREYIEKIRNCDVDIVGST